MLHFARTALIAGLTLGFAPAAQASFMIDWVNKATSGFDAAETAVVDTAIGRWESYITDMDGNAATLDTFEITINESSFGGIGSIDPTSIVETNMLPTSATMNVDNGSNVLRISRGFFVDPTPETDEEFTIDPGVDTYGTAIRSFLPGASYLRLDLLTLVTHELGHALGFAEGYTKWDAASDDTTATLNYDILKSVPLFGNFNGDTLSHVSCDTPGTRFDLMCSAGTFDNPATSRSADGGTSERRHVTELDLDILAGIYGYTVNKDALLTIASERASEVPEPASVLLFGIGMLMVPVLTRRRRRQAARIQSRR